MYDGGVSVDDEEDADSCDEPCASAKSEFEYERTEFDFGLEGSTQCEGIANVLLLSSPVDSDSTDPGRGWKSSCCNLTISIAFKSFF